MITSALTLGWLLLAVSAPVGQLQVLDSRLQVDGDRRHFEATLDIVLGAEVEEALHSGVPITLGWALELVDPDAWFGALWTTEGSWRLSYRPLSSHYSLRDLRLDRVRNYPSLRPLLMDLSQVSVPVDDAAPDQPLTARYRVRLEIGALPPPLRLPGYLSRAWRLDSGWVEARPETIDVDRPEPNANGNQ